ncbi:cell division topological determinant [Fictibacillus macauensis ZFHKF-1]|uniref:Cell division topological determinant n=1 Tax=Fictibacillus macauensis ZFHKF-1 TaxID=1196324 RepID=I8J5C2_9BACL|nr:PDZ domain-containing protein [Fictibacillus macauensis]EIT86976.1 cell division topological determinant [Fictibacillus macauensis ZFHKF-1]
MIDIYVKELLRGTAALFLHPLSYLFIVLAFVIGVKRVKRERKEFKVKVHPVIDNLLQSFFPGLLVGLLFSVVLFAAGVVVPMGMIALIGVMYALLALTMKTRFLNPAYAIGLATVAAFIVPQDAATGVTLLDEWMRDIRNTPIDTLAILMALLVLQEGVLIVWKGASRTSPRLFKGKRGQFVGAHEATRLWLVPQFLLIPGGELPVGHSWPYIGLQAVSYSIMLVPFAIGFRQLNTHSLPKEAIKATGKQVISLGVLLAIITAVGFLTNLPLLAVVAIIGGTVGRELITMINSQRDDNGRPFFTRRNNGLVVLGVVPSTPASKMGIAVGEIVIKANGKSLKNERDFYTALQINAAYCKLEVLDHKGEVRFVQRSLYENEHHELGLLFVHELVQKRSSEVS